VKRIDVDALPSKSFWTGTPVCVLGGTGFLGRHLVGQLLDMGAAVRTLSLPGPELTPHARLNALTGDVTDPAAVRGALAGAKVVFLAAGPVGAKTSAVKRMAAHGCALDCVLSVLPLSARLVLTSSVVTIGGTRRGTVLDETAPLPGTTSGGAYARAKCAAEAAALAAGRTRDVVIVNPGYLFGPDDPGPSIMGNVCVRFWRGHLHAPPAGGISGADVRDVATGHLLAAERGATGRRYVLGGENVRWAQLFAALARAGGCRPLLGFPFTVPAWAMWALATVGAVGSAITGRDRFITYELARVTRLCWFVSSARAEAELGYRRRPLRETLADTFAWHAARRRVAPRGITRLWLRRSSVVSAPVQSSQ
jgi:dihydroflavonol-4-reductase